jgi:hypothetical protein
MLVKAGLLKYKQLTTETALDKEQKLAALQKEIEEATTLELPMLQKNLTIIATLAGASTLLGTSWNGNWYDQSVRGTWVHQVLLTQLHLQLVSLRPLSIPLLVSVLRLSQLSHTLT